jgi:hypothetical protein
VLGELAPSDADLRYEVQMTFDAASTPPPPERVEGPYRVGRQRPVVAVALDPLVGVVLNV